MLAEIGYAVLASAMVWAGVHVVIKCNQYGVGSAWMKVNLLLLFPSSSSSSSSFYFLLGRCYTMLLYFHGLYQS